MTAIALPRISVPDFDITDMGKRIADTLGYEGLLAREKDLQLLGALKEINCLPFERAAVANYMAEQASKANWPSRSKGMIAVLLAVLTMIYAEFAPFVGQKPCDFVLLGIFVVTPLVIYAAHTLIPTFGWFRDSIGTYTSPIPIQVLDVAERIAKRLPDAKFRVHYLDDITERNARLDPFLSVIHGREEYFIAVWDEPDFNAAAR